MSYPVNQPIPYAATPATPGYVTADHSVDWSFDDGATATGLTTSKTWTTTGTHTATVEATNIKTNATGTAQKSIDIADWQAMTWINTTVNIRPTGSSGAGGAKIKPFIKYGNLLINCIDYYVPAGIVSYDTQNLVRNENATATASLGGGGASSAFLLTAGPNAGKILLTARSGLTYGFLDPSTLAFTLSPNSMASQLYDKGFYQALVVDIGSNNILFIGSTSGGGLTCQIYNQLTDVFTAKMTSGGPAGNSLLDAAYINGFVWVICDNTLQTFSYNVSLNAWAAGPSLVGAGWASGPSMKFARSNGFPFFVSKENPGKACWWDGTSPALLTGANFPLASLNSGILTNASDSIFETTDDGFVFMIGGYGASDTSQYSNNVIYSPYSNTFTKTIATPLIGFIRRSAFLNGRFWAAGDSGVLYKTSLW